MKVCLVSDVARLESRSSNVARSILTLISVKVENRSEARSQKFLMSCIKMIIRSKSS